MSEQGTEPARVTDGYCLVEEAGPAFTLALHVGFVSSASKMARHPTVVHAVRLVDGAVRKAPTRAR